MVLGGMAMAHDVESRRLAAIMAADMVGYSRLMELDEKGTLARLKAAQEELINPKVKEFGGRVVKTTGDGVLIEFPSAVNAVLCAVAVQREMADRESDVPEDRRIIYRVGINLGDIIIDGDDIFGDGVNVAARLEALAEPGGIRISEAVFNNVKGKLDLGFADLGPQKVKNLAEPIPTYKVLLDPAAAGTVVKAKFKAPIGKRGSIAAVAAILLVAVAGYFAWDQFNTPSGATAKSLIVLPFVPADSESEIFAGGATDNIISSLSRLRGMEVVPRSVSLTYQGIEPNLEELVVQNNVQYVLDGSVSRKNGSVDVSARLRDVKDSAVWQDTISGSPDEIFDLLAKLKKAVAGAMKVTLNPVERGILDHIPTKSIEAYTAFAEAERWIGSGDFTKFGNAIDLFESAYEIDPSFRDARNQYGWISYIVWSNNWNIVRDTVEALEMAEKTVDQVLISDPTDATALTLKLTIQLSSLDREGALTNARAAVFQFPNEPSLRFVLGRALLAKDQTEDARSELDKYLELSPRLNGPEMRAVSDLYLRLGDAEKALSLLQRIPDSEAGIVHFQLAEAYARTDQLELAKTYMGKVMQNFPMGSLAFFAPNFEVFENPQVLLEFASATEKAGLPASPFDMDERLKADRLTPQDLKEIFGQGSIRLVDNVDELGQPFETSFNKDGSFTGARKWLPGIEFLGSWRLQEDQVCAQSPHSYRGGEICSYVYWDRERPNEEKQRFIIVGNFGARKFAIERFEE